MDKKIQPLETKIDDVEQSLSARIDGMEHRIDRVENSLQGQIRKINLCLEHDIKPRLQNIEECYLSTFERYKEGMRFCNIPL